MRADIQVPVDQVIAWRRHFHANPELSFKDFNTSAYIAEQLEAMGLEVSRPTETSVLGKLVGTGKDTGRSVAWRADIDALPLAEETGEPFSSTVPGVMHACGHDATPRWPSAPPRSWPACARRSTAPSLNAAIPFLFTAAATAIALAVGLTFGQYISSSIITSVRRARDHLLPVLRRPFSQREAVED